MYGISDWLPRVGVDVFRLQRSGNLRGKKKSVHVLHAFKILA